jgi:DNA-binding HxlR family transcriptional regulator
MPLLTELHAVGGGSRFVPLLHALGASRDSLRQTLGSLVHEGLVMRNPGYGHPLRPEYVLTARGRRVAPACAALVAALRREGVEDVGLKKWSIPVLLELSSERRFAELREALGASPRALTLALKELAEAGLVERRVHHGFPPTSSYRLTRRARPISRTAARIAV